MNATAFRNMANVTTPDAAISMTSLHGKGIQASGSTFETTDPVISRLDINGVGNTITVGNNEAADHTHSWFLTTPTTGNGHEALCEVLSGAIVAGSSSATGSWLTVPVGSSQLQWICTPASGNASLRLSFRNAQTAAQIRGVYNLLIA